MTLSALLSGSLLDLADPKPELIDIEDICLGLAYTYRFNGRTRRPYSVAEHSCHLADLVPKEHRLQALLHDAPEAYLADVPGTLKPTLRDYQDAEGLLWSVIAQRFEVPEILASEVAVADKAVLITEAEHLLFRMPKKWDWPEPLPLPQRQWLNAALNDASVHGPKYWRDRLRARIQHELRTRVTSS